MTNLNNYSHHLYKLHKDDDDEDDQPQQLQPPPLQAPQQEPPPAEAPEPQQPAGTTRSGRVSRPPNWHLEYQSHLQTQAHPEAMTLEYSLEEARVIAVLFQYLEDKSFGSNEQETTQFVQTYSLKAGLKKFKEK
jgi:hypothetical protein